MGVSYRVAEAGRREKCICHYCSLSPLARWQIGIGIATHACAHTQTTREVLHLFPLHVAFGRIGEATDHLQNCHFHFRRHTMHLTSEQPLF